MKFAGKAKRLDDIDLPREAHRIGVGEDEIHAVLDVETLGSGFFPDGRLKMLPEGHIFYRELAPGEPRDLAIAAGLAWRRWRDRRPYPKSADARYQRLELMMKIDRDAALRSCSWALPQMMGFNCKLAGYPTAEAMIAAFVDDEEVQLRAMIEFIVNAGLDDELREHDWAGFARGYNGPGYAQHGYHIKLERRFRWWQGKPDTPWSPGLSVLHHCEAA
ncbi:N-acetylmuramidase family protein [Marinovum algicola]|uniref:N-acetylmuramidase family protein n=1 Tax=Marinovum algicola TaxID=42444 RepID=UPI003B522FEA